MFSLRSGLTPRRSCAATVICPPSCSFPPARLIVWPQKDARSSTGRCLICFDCFSDRICSTRWYLEVTGLKAARHLREQSFARYCVSPTGVNAECAKFFTVEVSQVERHRAVRRGGDYRKSSADRRGINGLCEQRAAGIEDDLGTPSDASPAATSRERWSAGRRMLSAATCGARAATSASPGTVLTRSSSCFP